MKTDSDLAALTGVVFQDGNLWALDPQTGQVAQVTGEGANAEFRNLRNASLLMFHTLTNAENWTEKLITWLEAAGGEEAVISSLRMQAAIAVTRRIAIEGMENIAVDKK